MSRAILAAIQAVRGWVFQNKSRLQTLAIGQGTPGTRAAPAQAGNNDAKFGIRIDNGETITKNGKQYKRYKVQANKGAENPTLRDIANHDSHRVLAQADLPLGEPDAGEVVGQFFEDLQQCLTE
jgi:hypothetical protein